MDLQDGFFCCYKRPYSSYPDSTIIDPAKNTDEQIILNNSVWFSQPEALNDPFEARPKIQWAENPPPEANFDHNTRAVYMHIMEMALRDIFSSTSIFCFTKNPCDIKMWSYYAAGHTGYCLIFDVNGGWRYRAADGEIARLFPQQVEYKKNYPLIDGDGDWRDPTLARSLSRESLLSKSDEWSFEAEWRMFRPSVRAGLQRFPRNSLRAIVLGACMKPADEERIRGLVLRRGEPIEIRQAKPARHEYRIVVE